MPDPATMVLAGAVAIFVTMLAVIFAFIAHRRFRRNDQRLDDIQALVRTIAKKLDKLDTALDGLGSQPAPAGRYSQSRSLDDPPSWRSLTVETKAAAPQPGPVEPAAEPPPIVAPATPTPPAPRPVTMTDLVSLWNRYRDEGDGACAPEGFLAFTDGRAAVRDARSQGIESKGLLVELDRGGEATFVLLPSFNTTCFANEAHFDLEAGSDRLKMVRRLVRPSRFERGPGGLVLVDRGAVGS